jgi:hypothetical protein
MKRYISYFLVLASILLITSCVKENYFGPNDAKKMKAFELEEQVGNASIDNDSLKINVTVAADANIKFLKAIKIEVSSFATVKPGIGEAQDFTNPVIYTIIAEDGSTAAYQVTVTRQGGNPQIPNSDFNEWHTVDNKYQDIGVDANDKTWGTGNPGASILGKYPTQPQRIDGSLAASMTTTDMGSLGGLVGKQTAAGSLYTGFFDISGGAINGKPVFGIPFRTTPSGFKVKYQYQPADVVRDGKGKVVPNSNDSCDIYVLLEHREDGKTKRLATAWFRSGDKQSSWKSLEMPLVYGVLPAGTPSYMLPKANETYGDITQDKPTHITVVFTSSSGGDDFIGAWGSNLIVDDFVLLY